jgi:hypothetical protein
MCTFNYNTATDEEIIKIVKEEAGLLFLHKTPRGMLMFLDIDITDYNVKYGLSDKQFKNIYRFIPDHENYKMFGLFYKKRLTQSIFMIRDIGNHTPEAKIRLNEYNPLPDLIRLTKKYRKRHL